MKKVIVKECKIHGLSKHRLRTEGNSYRCRKCIAKGVVKRRRKLKMMAIKYLGGKCCKCGYKKCIAALEFHHLDPSKKEFSLSARGMTRAWKIVKKELDKCILVCSNCHREIEYGE